VNRENALDRKSRQRGFTVESITETWLRYGLIPTRIGQAKTTEKTCSKKYLAGFAAREAKPIWPMRNPES
jgi:hypothetical protein